MSLLSNVGIPTVLIPAIDEARKQLPYDISRNNFIATAVKEYLKSLGVAVPEPVPRKNTKAAKLQVTAPTETPAHP
jgi:hypothetical protein